MKRLFLAILFVIVLWQPSSEAGAKEDEAAIHALNQQWILFFKNRDTAGLAGLFTVDGVRMPDGGTTAVGRQAIEAQYRKDFVELWKEKFEASIIEDQIVISGDYAFARGTNTLIHEANGKKVQETGKWMATFRKQGNGSWKYYWSTYNTN
ncbi:SgcJ/EcaC family oxidoreductase [bacterium]|nr:SgcJ/EcaC family oxidoreductase [bacterium]MCI0604659.1 SgcJ/EcaC family oxidoreductase [bacterium]